MIRNGSEVKEKYTGYVGTVVSRTIHITGCVECCVVANKLSPDGSPFECWFDESRLTLVKKAKKKTKKKKAPGGPTMSHPPQRLRPNRGRHE